MAVYGDIWLLLSVLSGIGLLAMGVAALRGGRARPRGGFALGLFAGAWGLQVLLGNAGSLVTDPAIARMLLLLSLPFLFLLPFLLFSFAATLLGRRQTRTWRALTAVAAVLAIGFAATLMVRPALWLKQVVRGDTGLVAMWGPLHPLPSIALFTALGIGLWGLWRLFKESPTPRTGEQSAALVTGLGLYVGYAGGRATYYGLWTLKGYMSMRFVVFTLLFSGLALTTGFLAWRAWEQGRHVQTREERRRSHRVAIALSLALLWGLVEGVANVYWMPELMTVGLWRLAGVGIMATALVRTRVIDLGRRTRRAARIGVGATAMVVGGALSYGLALALSAGGLAALVTAFIGSGLCAVPGARLGRRLLSDEQLRNPMQYREAVYERRIEAYRAALEGAMARGTLQEDEAFLAELRERFAVSDGEDRVLRYYARRAVLPTDETSMVGPYERLRLLREQGPSRAWLARDQRRDRLVRLYEPLPPWLDDDRIARRARTRAEALRDLRNPRIAMVHEVLDDHGRLVLALDHVAGVPLDEFIREQGPLPWREALGIAHDLLTALDTYHQAGLAHGRVRADTVLVEGDGSVRLVDPDLIIDEGRSGRTQITMVEPQDPYIPPAGSPRDPQEQDVYAVATLLHLCLRGHLPTSELVVTVAAPLPPSVERLLSKALAIDPDERVRDVPSMAEALRAAVKEATEAPRAAVSQ